MGIALRLLRWGSLLFISTLAAVTVFSAVFPAKNPAAFDPADVIIVFGAGMSPDGTLDRATRLRVQRGVALFDAGLAPRMHFTGGRAVPAGPSAGDRMAAMAIVLGVPDNVISRETRSLSTLQNALFSQPDLEAYQSAILVTEGFHLPRTAAALYWAGGPNRVQLAISTRFRGDRTHPVYAAIRMLVREAGAWWFNTARAAAFTAGGWIGLDRTQRERWLD